MRLPYAVMTGVLLLWPAGRTEAQPARGVLRARARAMQVIDGFSRTDWWVDPSSQPDTYHMAFPLVGGAVTFISDLDTLTVTVRPGTHHDFVVQLADGTTCLTRVSAVPIYPRPRVLRGDSLAVQVIPFTVRDHRIYVQGSINGSAPLLMQLDLGAADVNVNRRSQSKAPIAWDGSAQLLNSDGLHTMPASRANTVRIGALEWTNQRLVQTGNMERFEDVIIGNSLFRDRILEIDYDRSELRIHTVLPDIPPSFSSYNLALDGGIRPLIQAELLVDGQHVTDWYLFDTGLTSNLRISARRNREQRLAARLGARLGFGGRKLFRARDFRIAGISMPTELAIVETYEDVERGLVAGGAIGNAWLRRFNVILDNRRGFVWLAPTRAGR